MHTLAWRVGAVVGWVDGLAVAAMETNAHVRSSSAWRTD